LVFKNPIRTFFAADKELSKSIKNIFGFKPGNIFLYQLAFKHKSVSSETINGHRLSNERLEYLGDAILGAIVADFLFKKFPYKNEGFLTEMRSRIVNRASLNKLSQKLGLDKLVMTSKDNRGQFKSVNGDAFEAFVGALYLDKGYTSAFKIVVARIIELHIDMDTLEKSESNFKSKLIEWSQKEKKSLDFRMVNELGEGYSKQYEVVVYIDEKAFGKARDFSIKGAEQRAAEKSLNLIQPEPNG
jgi:ribonuclease III